MKQEDQQTKDEMWSEQKPASDADVSRLANALELAYARPWVLIRRGFINGFMSAVGAWVGSVLIIVLSGILIQHFNLITPVLQRLENTAIQTQSKAVRQLYGTPTPAVAPE
jgi:hypothetical protein